MHGFLNINKPAGLTSHDVVARVRRLASKGVKVGHAGTLDPAATGVLPVAIGQATRLIEHLADARKGYSGLVRLGVTTATDDGEGEGGGERAGGDEGGEAAQQRRVPAPHREAHQRRADARLDEDGRPEGTAAATASPPCAPRPPWP